MSLLQTLSTTLPVIFLVGIGLFFRRTQFIKPGSIADFKKLVVNLTLPLVLFKAFSSMQFEPRFLLIVASVFTACTLVMLAASRLPFLPGLTSPYSSYLMAGFEAGMLGYAVFSSTYGEANIPRFAVIDLGQVLFVFFVLVTRLEASQSRRLSAVETLKQFFKTPVIIAILVGILANMSGVYRLLAGWELTASVLNTAEILAGLTLPLVAIVIGYELSFKPGSLVHPLQTVLLRLVVWVALALAFNVLVIRGILGLDPIFEAAVMLMAVLPAPFVIPLYLRQGDSEERDYIINTLSLGTLAALAGVVIIRLLY
jgi:malate permease and related proteins